jgi:hypothetical protein
MGIYLIKLAIYHDLSNKMWIDPIKTGHVCHQKVDFSNTKRGYHHPKMPKM